MTDSAISRKEQRRGQQVSLRSNALTKVTTLAERLRGERHRSFVGRAAELDAFRLLLFDTSQSLLFIGGEVGVGKSALLQELQRLALEAGHRVAFVDGSELADHSAQARLGLRQRLLSLLEELDGSGKRGRSVLLVDSFELLGEHDWLLTEIVPALAADVLLVFASRSEVPAALGLDPAWSRLLVYRALSPFTALEAAQLLKLRGVEHDAHDAIVELAAGFPLALAVAAEIANRVEEPTFTVDCLQEMQHTLARLLCPQAVTAGQQLAMDVCCLARATTAELLEHARQSAAGELLAESLDLFGWLARQSFVAWSHDGLRPHLLVRIALESQLRRERPRRHRALSQSLREFSVAELEAGPRPQSDLASLFFLDRNVPLVRRWSPPLEQPVRPLEPAQTDDHRQIIELIASAEGDGVATLVAAWLGQEQDQFEVVRGAGVSGLLHFTRFDAESGPSRLPLRDPVTPLVRKFMALHPLQGSEEALLFRWFLDRDDYQTPSANVLAITGRQSQLLLAGKHVAYNFCVFRNPEDWIPIWKNIGLPWELVDRFTLGEHEYSLLVFMWRRRPLREVLLQAWRKVDEVPGEITPPLDELRLKVNERVASLAQKVKLTPREAEILEKLCLGHSFEDIAKNLSIRPRTVKFHQENLLRKTGASSRVELFRKLL